MTTCSFAKLLLMEKPYFYKFCSQAIRLMRKNGFNESHPIRITVEHVATMIGEKGISRETLRIKLANEVGKTPKEVLIELKIRRSLKMIAKGHGVARFANKVGYLSERHVREVIKKRTGMRVSEIKTTSRDTIATKLTSAISVHNRTKNTQENNP